MAFQTMSHTDVLQFFSFLQLKHQEFVSFSCLKHCVFWYWIHRVINFQNLLYTSKVIAKKPDLYHFLECVFFSVGHLHKSRHKPQINVLGACWFYFFVPCYVYYQIITFAAHFQLKFVRKRGCTAHWRVKSQCGTWPGHALNIAYRLVF